MKRRPYGHDVALSIRMAIALAPILLWYLLVAALLVGLAVFVVSDPTWKNVLSVGFFALRGGLAVQALCIVPARTRGWRRFELFSDHPRLERLGELSRQLGKAG